MPTPRTNATIRASASAVLARVAHVSQDPQTTTGAWAHVSGNDSRRRRDVSDSPHRAGASGRSPPRGVKITPTSPLHLRTPVPSAWARAQERTRPRRALRRPGRRPGNHAEFGRPGHTFEADLDVSAPFHSQGAPDVTTYPRPNRALKRIRLTHESASFGVWPGDPGLDKRDRYSARAFRERGNAQHRQSLLPIARHQRAFLLVVPCAADGLDPLDERGPGAVSGDGRDRSLVPPRRRARPLPTRASPRSPNAKPRTRCC